MRAGQQSTFQANSPRRRPPAGGAALLVGLFLLGALSSWAQGILIQEIRWEGLRRIPRDTMNARILSKPGDPYDPKVLRRDFQAVWNTNFFEDVRLEVEDGEKGKIIYFIVQERPLIRRIEYNGVNSVTQSEILERFRERRVGLSVEMQYDPTRVRRAEVVLKELLSERGRHFASVSHETRRVPPNAVILIVVVEEGPKVKVGTVSFQGNRRFSDRKLWRTMKGSRPYGLPPWFYFLSKTYHAGKVQEDLERVREAYQERGYFRVIVQPPETRMRDTQPWLPLRTLPWWFKPGKAVDMRIGVEEGPRYRMGELTVRSTTGKETDLFFAPEFLRKAFPLKQGDIFNVKKIRTALEDYRKLYSEFGFINMTTIPETKIDDNTRVIDLTLEFEPNKQFIVHRIEFMGNTTTRDKVIRRELLLDEGAMFNSRLWELSILRLNQLGYFEELRPENAEVRQNAEEGTIDLTLKVKEKGKNSIGLTGGTSGVLGSFVGINYSTNNFLGLGETLSVNLEYGDRQRAFVFGFTEPYFLDRPIQTGFTFSVRRFEFDQARESTLITGQRITTANPFIQERLVNYIQNSTGFSVFASYPLKRRRFTRLGLTYAFDVSDIQCLTEGCTSLFEGINFRAFTGPNALEGIRSSRVTPSFLYNTTNHPVFPTRGTSMFVSGTLEGGPLLGGNQKTFRPAFEIKHFRPINRGRNTLAFRLLGSFLTGFGGRVPAPFTRFYIGGEDTVRGFDIRAVSPLAFVPVRTSLPVFFLDPTRLDPNGNPRLRQTIVEVLNQTVTFPGGDTQLVGNFEYRIPIAGPVSLAPFLDVGLNTILRPSQLRLTPENLASLRTDFPDASVPDSLDLVPGTNTRIRTSGGLELVINLPIVNAPFRIYWAYNLSRLKEEINIPASSFSVPAGITLPPGVFESQILPQLGVVFRERTVSLFEPVKTFRFTISRTF
ncbi:MAG: outer membrane protein assembly factor BamA [Terriglobia bacterium]